MPERQCDKCIRQAEWGCKARRVPASEDDPAAVPDANGQWWLWLDAAHVPLTVDGDESYACPRQPVREEPLRWARMLLYYGMYKQGHLPQAGAVMDQSFKAIEVFRILDDVNHECDRVEDDKRYRQPGRPGR